MFSYFVQLVLLTKLATAVVWKVPKIFTQKFTCVELSKLELDNFETNLPLRFKLYCYSNFCMKGFCKTFPNRFSFEPFLPISIKI